MLDPKALLAYCESELDALVHCLRQAVEIESPSQNKTAIDRMANFFAQEFSKRGAKVQMLSHPTAGSAVVAEFWPGQRRARNPSCCWATWIPSGKLARWRRCRSRCGRAAPTGREFTT